MRKYSLLILVQLIIFSASLVVIATPNSFDNIFKTSNVSDGIFTNQTNDDKTIYYILFHHLEVIKNEAEKATLAGETPIDNHAIYKSQAKLDDVQTQFLFQTAESCMLEIKPINEKINLIIKESREKYSNTQLKQGDNIPLPPEELQELWTQKDETVLKYKGILQNTFGEEKFTEFNKFATDKIAPNIERNIFKYEASKNIGNNAVPPVGSGCYGYSLYDIDSNNSAHILNMETGTALYCNMIYYYDPGIQSFLFEDGGLISSLPRGFTSTYSDIWDYTGQFTGQAGKTYKVRGDHWVRSYQGYVSGGQPYWHDYYGLNFFQGNYPSPYGFSSGPYHVYTYNLYKAASTEISYTVPVPPPHLDSIDVTGFPTGDGQTTYVRGTALASTNRSAQVSGSGVTARLNTSQSPTDGTILDIIFDVAQNAQRGQRQLTLTVGGVTSNALTITVGDNSPQITNMTPPEANAGDTVAVTISGNHFGINPQIQILGTNVQSAISSATTTEITALFSVADAATAGQRGVRVKSLGYTGTGFQPVNGTSDLSNITDFTVNVRPTIRIDPFDTLELNGKRDVRITINGSNGNSNAYITQGLNSGGVVFDENNSPSISLAGNGVKVVKIKSSGFKSFDLNDWKITAQNGSVSASQVFTVPTVTFEESATCTGFDPNGDNSTTSSTQPYLFAAQNGNSTLNSTVKAKIIPSGASGNFRLESSNATGFSVSPQTISSNEQILTLTGGSSTGDFDLKVFGNETTDFASKLKVSVRKRINKTVIIHAVTEDNDDMQTIPRNASNQPQGEPNQISIEPSTTTLLTTLTGGNDDQRIIARNSRGVRSYVITTGLNGIAETTKAPKDVEKIPINQGKPNSLCVAFGANGERDTEVATGDEVSADDQINTGANGLCETIANNTDIVPTEASIPNAIALQDYLNNTNWGKQANIFFTVTRDTTPRQVNFDLDRNGYLNTGYTEFNKISDNIADGGIDLRLYYQKFNLGGDTIVEGQTLFGTDFSRSYFSPNHRDSVNNLASHEIGHGIRGGHNSRLGTLMYEFSGVPGYPNPCSITQSDLFWVNPLPSN
jgi:hypothetical protein